MSATILPIAATRRAVSAAASVPRLGFLGTGWIGRNRMRAVLDSGAAEVAAIADTASDSLAAARAAAPRAEGVRDLEALLRLPLDGIVIATPSALHAEQAIAALERGIAVFCQKPLACTAADLERVIIAAWRADRLLGVDMSYRHTRAMQAVRELVRSDGIGRVFAADLVFHNACGPDKPWFRDRALSGGGCLIDLGVHLVDLALWTLDFPRVEQVSGSIYARGRELAAGDGVVEDYAAVTIELERPVLVRIACSWNLHAGHDAIVSAAFHGTRGGAAFNNVGGSFYDFEAWRFQGTARQRLVAPPDAWGGRAILHWIERLSTDRSFDPEVEALLHSAGVLDSVYRQCGFC